MSPRNPSSDSSRAPTAPSARSSPRSSGFLTNLLFSREFGVIVVLVVICLIIPFTEARDRFFLQGNIQNILRNMALLGVFAIGQTLVIITGGIDLSLGSVIAFTGMLMALVMTRLANYFIPEVSMMAGLTVALLAGFLIGCVHATLIHQLKLPPFVVTLASMLFFRSQSLLINKRLPITLQDFPAVLFLANGNLFEGTRFAVPMPLVILLVVALFMIVALHKMRIGRYLYSVGSNEQATRLSGVNVYSVKLFAYGMSGLLGGLAGILAAAYGGQGDPQVGSGYELEAVAASVVGGANLMGGQGSVAGTILGALLLYTIFSAINLTLADPNLWQGTVVGTVLLFAVLVMAFQQRRARTA